jgi:hypothetical protein
VVIFAKLNQVFQQPVLSQCLTQIFWVPQSVAAQVLARVAILATQAQNIQFFALVHAMQKHHQHQLSHVPLEPTLEMIYHLVHLNVMFAGKDITVLKH